MELRPGYKQTEVGIIPEDWQVRPMLSMVRIANGQVDPKIEPFRSMILVAPDHIERASGRLLKMETACEQRAISGKYLFSKGDIVYSKIRPYLRKAIVADFEGLCSADMYPLKPGDDVDGKFVLAILLGHHFSRYAESVSVRSGMPKINRIELAEYKGAFPPTKAEQEAIAEALSDADTLIESMEQLLTKKRQIKQGVLYKLLNGKKRLPGFSEDWKLTKLGACLLTPPDYGINAAAVEYSDRLPSYMRITDITTDGRFSPHPLVSVGHPNADHYYLSEGELVFARTGASVGKSCLYNPLDGLLVFAGFLIRIRPDPLKLNSAFLFALVQTVTYWNWVKVMSMRSGQPGINANEFAHLPITIPTIIEQEAIAAVLADLDMELVEFEKKLTKATHLKQAMMQELLTGKTRLI